MAESSEMLADMEQSDVKHRKHQTVPPPVFSARSNVHCDDEDLMYGVDDHPPWYTSVILGFQQCLLMFGGSVSLPLIVSHAMCIGDDDVGKSEVMSTAFFVAGITTLLQTTIGSRLPIVQGGSYTFVPPLLAIMSLPKWKCPQEPDISNLTSTTEYITLDNDTLLLAWRREVWTSRMREVQGAIIMVSLLQVLVGLTGLLGFLLRFIGPLSIAPTICLIGLPMYEPAAEHCGKHWGIAVFTIFLITLFSQYLRNISIPFTKFSHRKGWHHVRYPVFKLLSVFLSIVVASALCWVLTAAGALPSDPSLPGYGARTDTRLQILSKAKWFRFPYPGQWGMPTVSTATVLAMMPSVLASMLESVGDYYACAHLAGIPPPPVHAINRGILFEGVGGTCAGLWGSGSGVTCFSENIGAIGITKVACRRVIQVGALIMIFFGMFGKFGALLVTIPQPIIGGIFMVVFGMIMAAGVSNLQFVNMNSSRNRFIFGFAIFIGLCVPRWVNSHPNAISTGTAALDEVLTALLSTNMFIGGFAGFLLDNTISGTPEERGLILWSSQGVEGCAGEISRIIKSPYDFPFGLNFLTQNKCSHYLPFCPSYTPVCTQNDTDGEMHVDMSNADGQLNIEEGDGPKLAKLGTNMPAQGLIQSRGLRRLYPPFLEDNVEGFLDIPACYEQFL